MYNLYSKRMQSIVVNIDDYQMKLVLHSVQIDCSGNIFVFGFKPTKGGGTKIYTPKLSLYKVPSYIDTSVTYSQNGSLSAQIVYYDNDTIDIVYTPPIIRIDTQVCNSFTYRNKTYTQSGTYSDTIFSTSYSDTIFKLNLIVYRDRYDTVRKIVCDSTYYFNSWYKNSGLFTTRYKSANSCDSFHTLDLTVNNSKRTQIKLNSCRPYKWDDVLYRTSGIYTRLYRAANQCDSTVTLDLNVGVNDQVILSNGTQYSAVQDNVSYQWYLCKPYWKIIGNAKSKTFRTTTMGGYAVVLDDGKGCVDTSDCIALYSSSLTTTIEPIVRIYPNPFQHYITVELDRVYNAIGVKLYDITGRIIFRREYHNLNSIRINQDDLPRGLYYLRVETESFNQFSNLLKE